MHPPFEPENLLNNYESTNCGGAFSKGGSLIVGIVRCLGLVGLAAACLSGVPARAAADKWTSTTSGLWGTAGNWSVGVPTGASTVDFNSSAGLELNLTL